jgi:phosphatidylglycerophosphatase A
MQRLGLLVATCGRLGFVPVAPGTFGSAAGLALWFALQAVGAAPAAELLTIALLFGIGVWSAGVTEQQLGLDPSPVIIDEVVGMLITIALLPLNAFGLVAAFILFRLLDIVKPWPAGRFEHLPGGLGVMADDAMAGVYGNLLMRGAVLLAPGWLT